ncbi:hypothetical protein OQA88_3954 [Cercophora sp. LCS_1]
MENHQERIPVSTAPLPTAPATTQVYQENGRYYGTFKKGKYMFPIDEPELDRMDIFHKFFMIMRREQHFTAPIHNKESPRVIDLGCGTGIWAIDIAELYPRGHVTGMDLNLIQPEFIPPNIRFLQMDIETPWQDLEPGTWDLVHLRTLGGSVLNWPRLYQEIYRHLRPYYGFVEQVEINWLPRSRDGTLPPNSYLSQWAELVFDAMDGFDRPMRIDGNVTKKQMTDAGLVDVKEEVFDFAINGWPEDSRGKEIGRWFNLGFTQGLQALSLAPLSRGHGKTPAEITSLLDKVLLEARSLKIHTYFTMHVFTARRPQ